MGTVQKNGDSRSRISACSHRFVRAVAVFGVGQRSVYTTVPQTVAQPHRKQRYPRGQYLGEMVFMFFLYFGNKVLYKNRRTGKILYGGFPLGYI